MKEVLSGKMVANIEASRAANPILVKCDNNKKIVRKDSWGPFLVERQRRTQVTRISMMQRAMELKKKKESGAH
jgi:hypothetical protein